MMPETGISWGRILRHRFRPKAHRFTYPVFMFSMDLDEVPRWERKRLLFAYNRFSLYTLRDSDHGSAPGTTLKAKVLNLLAERGFEGRVDKVFMVTQFRVLGYLFNPVTFSYCYRDGAPVAYVAEVKNTIYQRHSYAFFGGETASYRTEKVFYVSPFVDMGTAFPPGVRRHRGRGLGRGPRNSRPALCRNRPRSLGTPSIAGRARWILGLSPVASPLARSRGRRPS